MEKWSALSATDCLSAFTVNPDRGLPENAVQKQRQIYGLNELPHSGGLSFGRLFLLQFSDFMVLILLLATGISWSLGEAMDAATILTIVLLNAVLGTVQEYKAEKALTALKSMAAPKVKVIRSGEFKIIDAVEIVPGDIMMMEAGDRIAADGRILECNELEIDESLLTGESIPVLKSSEMIRRAVNPADEKNMVFSGSTVTRGKGKAVVTATGKETQVGQIAAMITTVEESETPLQKSMRKLGRTLLTACLAVCAAVGAAGIVRGEPLRDMFMTAVSLAVAAIPEGLPAIVTIVLAMGVQKMAKRKAIIRKLPAVETLGCATVICTDKTGTLTENKMRVEKTFQDGKVCDILYSSGEPEIIYSLTKKSVSASDSPAIAVLMENFAINNNSIITPVKRENIFSKPKDRFSIKGDPTENALVELALAKGYTPDGRQKGDIIKEFPFSSERRRMSVIYRKNDGFYLSVKGAPEVVLEKCTHLFWHGRVITMESRMFHDILARQTAFAKSALRTLAFAFRKLEDNELSNLSQLKDKDVEKGLVFLGLVGMMDPPRPQVPEAIKKSLQAGVAVKMITGDHPDTAMAIARLIGLPLKEKRLLTGEELEKIPERQWPDAVQKCSVFARVTPAHKLKIVRTLKKAGEVVAMTGDGVNDAPAVKEADIGVAMGLTGTEVTKEASAMVVGDDNFATIVNAVEEGRAIYENIRKFIRYLLGCNIGEVLLMFTATVAGLPLPLLPIQLLFVNLVTDGLPAIALGVDTSNEDMMKRPPRSPGEGIFSRGLGLRIIVQGVLIGIVSLLAYLMGSRAPGGSVEAGRTMAFATLVFSQMFYVFQCRAETKTLLQTGIFGNMFLVGAVILSVWMQVSVMSWPPLMGVFHTVFLSPPQWLAVVLLGGISLIWTESLRFLKRMFIHR